MSYGKCDPQCTHLDMLLPNFQFSTILQRGNILAMHEYHVPPENTINTNTDLIGVDSNMDKNNNIKQYKCGKTVFHKHTKTSFNLSMQILFVNIYLPVLGMFWQMTLFKLIHSLYTKTYIQLGPCSVAQEECCMQDQVHQALELSYSFQGHQENDLLCMMVIHNTIEHH